MAFQRLLRAHPHGLELLGFVGHGCLAFGHAGDEEGHVEAPRQVAVARPARQHKDLVGRQAQAPRGALRGKRCVAIERSDVGSAGRSAIGVACQQDAKLFKTFSDGGDGLRELLIRLAGAARARGVRGWGRVQRVNAAAGENVGTWRKTRLGRTPRHQHLQPAWGIRRVAHQQDGGGRKRGDGFALRVQPLGRAGHGAIIEPGCQEISRVRES